MSKSPSDYIIPEFPESPKSRPQHRTLDRFFTCLHSLTWWFSSLSYTVYIMMFKCHPFASWTTVFLSKGRRFTVYPKTQWWPPWHGLQSAPGPRDPARWRRWIRPEKRRGGEARLGSVTPWTDPRKIPWKNGGFLFFSSNKELYGVKQIFPLKIGVQWDSHDLFLGFIFMVGFLVP